MNTWILFQMSVISLPLQRQSLQGFNPDWGSSSEQGCAKGFQPCFPVQGIFPRAFGDCAHLQEPGAQIPLGIPSGSLSKLENCNQHTEAGP